MNAHGEILYINRRLAEISGYQADDLVGRNGGDRIFSQALGPVGGRFSRGAPGEKGRPMSLSGKIKTAAANSVRY